MGLDVYFFTVDGETGKIIIELDDEFRGRDLYTIVKFAMSRSGAYGYPANEIGLKRSIENYKRKELSSDWFVEKVEEWFVEVEESDSVWFLPEELQELLAAVVEFTQIMANEEQRNGLIPFTTWNLYYPDEDWDHMWWVKDPVEYFNELGRNLKEALRVAIDRKGYFCMCVSY